MLKRDKNGFIKIIEELGLNFNQFEAFEEERDNYPTFIIRFRDAPFEFLVRNPKHSYTLYATAFTQFTPGFTRNEGYNYPDWKSDIEEVYDQFSYWLENHVKLYLEEQDIPDLWSKVERERKLFMSLEEDEEDDYRPFTIEEKKFIYIAIKELRVNIVNNYAHNAEEIKLIDQKLNYLTEAVERLNRFDWKSLLISTLMGIITTLSLDTNSGRALFELAKQIFTGAIKFLI